MVQCRMSLVFAITLYFTVMFSEEITLETQSLNYDINQEEDSATKRDMEEIGFGDIVPAVENFITEKMPDAMNQVFGSLKFVIDAIRDALGVLNMDLMWTRLVYAIDPFNVDLREFGKQVSYRLVFGSEEPMTRQKVMDIFEVTEPKKSLN